MPSLPSLHAQIIAQRTAATKQADIVTRDVLRMLESAITYELKKAGANTANTKELCDEDIVKIIRREHRKREEAIEAAKQGHRADIVDRETKEAAVLKVLLPAGVSSDDIEKAVRELITGKTVDVTRPGAVIGQVMKKFAGRADGAIVNQVVNQIVREHAEKATGK